MRYVARQDNPVTASQIAEQLKLPRASVYRLITTLEDENVLQRARDRGSVELSDVFLRLMIAGASNEQIIAGFEEALVSTAQAWSTTAFLARLNGAVVEIVHAVTPKNLTGGYVHPGTNIRPAHACSAARAIVAFLPEKQSERIIGRNFSAYTDKTITEKEALATELELTKQRGYAVCDEEIDIGITSVAAPISIGRAGVVCSLGIVSFTKQMSEHGLSTVGEYLRSMANGSAVDFNHDIYKISA